MAVNLLPPQASALHPVAGVDLGWAQAGIRKAGRKDLLLVRIAPGAHVAAVFTRNRFCAAPVQVAREHLEAVAASGASIRMLVVNTGCANAGTGQAGVADAQRTCTAAAALLGSTELPTRSSKALAALMMRLLSGGLDDSSSKRSSRPGWPR